MSVFADALGTFAQSFGLSREAGATFGLLAVSTFLLTTLDTCTRLGRFVFCELFNLRGAGSRVLGSVATLILPTVLVFTEICEPSGARIPCWKAVWPAFGTTNQLLAALALLVVFAWLKREGRKTLFIAIPMIAMCVVTLTSLCQLIWKHLFATTSRSVPSLLIGSLCLLMAILALVLISNTALSLGRRKGAGTAIG